MTDLTTPNSFTSGTTIVAADVNANFAAIETMVNTTGVPKVQDGAVDTTAKIADGVVSTAKLADGSVTEAKRAAIPRCSMSRSSLNITSGVAASVSGGTELEDTASMHSTSSNTERIVAPEAGVYLIEAFVAWSSASSGTYRRLEFKKNGSVDRTIEHDITLTRVQYSYTIRLAANDYVSLDLTADYTASPGVMGCIWGITKVGP